MFRLMKLKPPHGWSAVSWELAIVTLGVLIALGAQQVVESWNWDRKVAAAEQSMNEEIRNSLLAVAEMNRLDKCSNMQLEALHEAIVRDDATTARKILHDGNAFGISRLWADNAFQATLAAQVSDHLGADKLKRYSQVYQMIRDIRSAKQISEQPSSNLALLYFGTKLPATSEARQALLGEVASLRLQMLGMRADGDPVAQYAKKDLGLEVTEREYLRAPGRAGIVKLCEASAAAAKALRPLPPIADGPPETTPPG
jgi:hypothetical protein